MMGLAKSAFVIGRRDFTATVYSRSFFLFLMGPLVILAISFTLGNVTEKMARQEARPNVAVIATDAQFDEIAAARERLKPAFGEYDLVALKRETPDYVVSDQIQRLLQAPDKKVLAVLTGGVDHPRLTGAIDKDGREMRQVKAILDNARQNRALSGTHATVAPVQVDLVRTEQSAGSLATGRSLTARIGQMLLFMLTVLLASMLLSNLIEEKSNKIIEVLAAAVPIDSIFFGKLVSMLCVSLVGIAVWTAAAIIGARMMMSSGASLPEPAVGWPAFVILVALYFTANYLLLGALFLGIGSQAASVREVQTLSMPVTIGQVVIFMFASVAAAQFNSVLGIGAAIFPFSSPLTMIARAAQTPELWPHAVALVWQASWVWLTVQLGASLFRSNVMKSGSGAGLRLKRAKA